MVLAHPTSNLEGFKMSIELSDFIGRDNLTMAEVLAIRTECEALIDASTPGRFEGASLYAPWFYEIGMSGSAEYGDCDCGAGECNEECAADCDDDHSCDECSECCASHDWLFDVSDVDRVLFPELMKIKRVRMPASSAGFIDAIAD